MEMLVKGLIIILFVFGSLVTISNIGKPRTPTTPGMATIVVIIHSLLIAGILAFWDV